MKKWIFQFFADNFVSKVVALIIALVLWMTILGRRDFIQTKQIEVELYPSSQYLVTQQSTDHIRIRVSGVREALKRFIESPTNQTLLIDVSDRTEGPLTVEVPIQKIELPLGVKILSIKPTLVKAVLVKKSE